MHLQESFVAVGEFLPDLFLSGDTDASVGGGLDMVSAL